MAKGTPPRKVKPKQVINCSICEKPLKGLQSLENHRIRAHTLEKPHACGVCGKLFHIEKERKYHEQIHKGVKSYSCTECDKTYTKKNSLDRHIASIHQSVEYKCPQCEVTFTSKKLRRVHLKRYEGCCKNTYMTCSSHSIKE